MGKLFQDELIYLRDIGREFSRLNPKLAKYLSESSTDPDVERLLEGFAFLTSSVREKIEDEFPEFTHSIISLLWPNFLRPFPSATMMKLNPVDRSITQRQIVPKSTEIQSGSVDGVVRIFRTTTDCTVYPLEIESAQLVRSRDGARIHMAFKTLSGLPLGKIGLDTLRLSFTGEAAICQTLHLWMGRYLRSISDIPEGEGPRELQPATYLTPIGFSNSEAILPQPRTAFDGHRLLQEFFVFPEKFLGYDLLKLQSLFDELNQTTFYIEFDFERPFPADFRLLQDSISLYCVPAVNLMETSAEPLLIRHKKNSYPVRPQSRETGQIEIFSINSVTSHVDGNERTKSDFRVYPPFESFDHEIGKGPSGEQIYFRQRVLKAGTGRGFKHEISFVEHNSATAVPKEETLSVDLTCFNPDLCDELGVGTINEPARSAPAFVRYTNVTRPTAPVYPPLDGTLNWNLISNLSLNYISMLDRDAIVAVLAIYDYPSLYDRQAERAAQQRLSGISALTTRPVDRLFKGMPVRGLKSTMTMKESAFQTEGEMYLFASILAEFFSLYATVNSFHHLEVQGEEHGELYVWYPRIGRQPLI